MMNTPNIKRISIVNKVLIAVAVVSILVMVLRLANASSYRWVLEQFALFSDLKILNFRFWQFVTYSFIHADPMHLVFNLLMLYLFSQLFFTFFNNNQFLKAYFLGGLAAGIFYVLGSNLLGMHNYVVGASGAVMAVFFTIVGYNPKINVHLIIFGRVAIWIIALAFIAFDVIQLFFDNAGGHLAHIGGSIFGFAYGNYLKGFSFSLNKPKQKTKLKTVHKVNNSQRINQKDDIQKQIDVILDKISKSGYDSLTKDEKEFLFRQK